MDTGVFVVSIDTEMAWGVVDRGDISKNYTYIDERGLITNLLGLLEEYDIHATWSVVGHLFLDHCERAGGLKHPDIVRPPYSWVRGDWFDNDPCTDLDHDEMWYGRDIVENIGACATPQEIASHSFSHFIAGDPEFTEEAFQSDLAKCREVATPLGLTLRSFVYPRNSIGHLKVLEDNGFLAFRGHTQGPKHRFGDSGIIGMCKRLSSLWSGFAEPTWPQRVNGLWNIPPTYFYNPTTYMWKFLPNRMDVRKVKQQLNVAAENRSLVHLWFHPHNLTAEPERSLYGLQEIFQHFKKLSSQGLMVNSTMGELAANLNSGLPIGN